MSDTHLADPPAVPSADATEGCAPPRWIGRDRRRVEDARLLTGKGNFVDDRHPAGCLHAVFVRSPFAHGRLRGVETAEASAMSGVVAVYTGADVAGASIIYTVDGKSVQPGQSASSRFNY